MIHIDHVLIHKLSMPLVTPFETSSAKIDHKELIILEVRDQSGITVFSECVAKQIPNYMPETVDTAIVMLTNHILPLIMHRSFDTPQTIEKNTTGTINIFSEDINKLPGTSIKSKKK